MITNQSVGWKSERWSWVPERKREFEHLLLQIQGMGNDCHGLFWSLSYSHSEESSWSGAEQSAIAVASNSRIWYIGKYSTVRQKETREENIYRNSCTLKVLCGLCKVLALLILYFLCHKVAGQRFSFPATMLVTLPSVVKHLCSDLSESWLLTA